jgi:hypothetical protein
MRFLARTPARYVVEKAICGLIPTYSCSHITQVTRLFGERLAAWKHAVGYLEDYITATEKVQHAHGKEYEKVLKASYGHCGSCVEMLIPSRLSRTP